MPARINLILCTLLLGGCSLTPPYQRPEMPALPPTLGGDETPTTAAPDTPGAAAAALSKEEKQLLANFSPRHNLAPLVALTLRHNAQFRNAMLRVGEARAQYRLERANRLPTVALQAEAKRTRFDNPDLDAMDSEHYVATGAGLDFDPDFFGRLASLAEAARERYLGSEHGLEAARAALIAEVLRAYTVALAGAETWHILQEADDYQRQLDNYARRQFDVGLISRDQLDAQRVAAAAHHAATANAEAQARAAQRALRILTGPTPSFDDTAASLFELVSEPVPVSALRSLESRVLLDRPDILQAEAELRARNADIGAARAAFFPSIHLSTGAGTVSESLGGLFKAGSGAWTFNPGVSLPIFDGGRNKAQLALAELRKDAGVAAYAQAIESAFQEVAGALDLQPALAAGEAAQRRRSETLQRRTRALTLRVLQGLQDPTELLNERLQAQQARLAHVDAARDLALNHIRLLHAFYGTHLPSQ